MNGYKLTRNWFDYKFENPSKVRAIHTDFYIYLVDQWNRLGKKEEFGLPTSYTKECLGIGSYNTYKKTLSDLVNFGFVKIIKDSKNQHISKIIALSKYDEASDKPSDKALDEATIKAIDKPTDTIIKQYNNLTIQQINKILTYFNSIPISDIDLKIDEIIKEEKEDKPKKPRSVFTPPVISDVISYFEENGYTKQSAEKAFKYYSVANWKDSKGDQVKNWKQKMQGVWFKDENKEKTDNRSKKMQEIAEKIMNGTL